MKWRSHQSSSLPKKYSTRIVSVCLLLIILLYSCSKTTTGIWVGAGVGAVAIAPIGYISLNDGFCYSCSSQKHLSDDIYSIIGLGLFGLITGGILGGLLGDYFEEEVSLFPQKANSKVFEEKADLKQLYFSAIRIGDVAVLDKLLTKYPRYITSVDEEGLTGLHKTTMLGYKEASQNLILHRININSIDYKGRTPLHYAAIYRHLDIYQYLVEEGAKTNIKDNDGKIASEYIK